MRVRRLIWHWGTCQDPSSIWKSVYYYDKGKRYTLHMRPRPVARLRDKAFKYRGKLLVPQEVEEYKYELSWCKALRKPVNYKSSYRAWKG